MWREIFSTNPLQGYFLQRYHGMFRNEIRLYVELYTVSVVHKNLLTKVFYLRFNDLFDYK